MNTTILLGAGASVAAGIPPARKLLEKALTDPEPWEELGVKRARDLLCLLAERCGPYWEEQRDWAARRDVFEIEALVNTVQALASRDNWLGNPFVNEWNSVLRDFEATAESLNAAYAPIMPLPYLNGTPLAGRRIHCGGWDTGPNWQSPFAALRSILLFVVTNLTILRADADVSYLEPITRKWLDDDRTTVASLNYDNALETSARGVGVEVDDGIGSYQRTRRVSFSSGGMPLLKLHGSGSWAEQRIAGEATGGEDFLYAPWANLDANHYNGKWIQPAIIMGGENKLQARGPFLELYIEFQRRLRDTNRLVTVGYSFRDPHINEAIRVWIRDTPKRDEPRLVVIDPAERFPVRNIYATHRPDLLPWLQRRADDHGTLEKALNGSNSDIQAAAVPDPWNVRPESTLSR